MSNITVTRGNLWSSRIIRWMPLASVVSKGRGNFTCRMSLDTGARLSRSTLLVGVDLSCPASPWLHADAASATARITAAAARFENCFVVLRFIAYPFVLRGRILFGLRSDFRRVHFFRKSAHLFCHSEPSEESLLGSGQRKEGEILRSAQNDKNERLFK